MNAKTENSSIKIGNGDGSKPTLPALPVPTKNKLNLINCKIPEVVKVLEEVSIFSNNSTKYSVSFDIFESI